MDSAASIPVWSGIPLTKLRAPRVRRDALARPALLERLSALVEAHPGRAQARARSRARRGTRGEGGMLRDVDGAGYGFGGSSVRIAHRSSRGSAGFLNT